MSLPSPTLRPSWTSPRRRLDLRISHLHRCSDPLQLKQTHALTYRFNLMETIWGEDCSQFRPERWLSPETGKFVLESPYRYPVFQGGQRVCVGKEMALMEMKTVAVAIIRDFDIELVGSCSWPPIFSPGLNATLSGGLPVRVHRRCRSLN